jgi:hypothetical protein
MVNFKKIIAFIIVFILCGYSAWKGMQTLAIVSIALLFCILYMDQVKQAVKIGLALAKQTKQAKFKDFEINLADPFRQVIIDCIPPDKLWAKAIVSDFTSAHIALLIAINKAGTFRVAEPIKSGLRDLRDKGLLDHNNDSIKNADTVWLTELGKELVLIFR